MLLAPGAASPAARFAFAAFGDTPYNAAEALLLPGMISEMNREELAFTIHVGDFKSPRSACTDTLYRERRASFDRSRHPFIYVPGDNDWLDCNLSRTDPRDPLERLAKLREIFFATDTTLGERRLPVERQAKRGYAEHLRWVVDTVVFATLNVPGHTNNAGASESAPRTAAAIDWMREAFRIARSRELAAVSIVLHADPWYGEHHYQPILEALADEARRFRGEVLLVHGDTHRYRFDQPLIDSATKKPVPNVTRLEVYGSPFVNWVLVTVTVEDGKARFNATTGGQRDATR